ncbi:TIGR03503 family protein [Alteromonas halophila]|uniref:TIGR03503 family protein n=1 Tax=Alteromonas halophila TaxID=516698 RepID=UPI001E48E08D|nr:TIGR03503 family protein [Alteromonas halophila]
MKFAFIALLMVMGSGAALAQDNTEQRQPAAATDVPAAQDTKPSPIKQIGSDYHNDIVLLRNRFRVDYEVDEVTMVFFREYGTAPVVLVRPDGSKIFQSQVGNDEDSRISWYDAVSYDMIRIKNPVPGPWQAVGQILPDSRVMVISDIELHAQPLPPVIFSGEILKSTASLTNGGEPIDSNEFRDVVELTITLVSTNNPNFDNFGAQTQQVATFQDNGRGMDEAPLDGVFTGQFNLAIAPGEWTPVFEVSTPLFSREQISEPLRLYPNPVEMDVKLDGGGDGYHKLMIDVDRDLVDISSLLIDGKVRFPNGDIQNFSLTKPSDKAREHLIVAYEEGVFRVKLTAYGTTMNGRDFILDVPEYTFVAEMARPEMQDPMAVGQETDEAAPSDNDSPSERVIEAQGDLEARAVTPEAEESMDTTTLITLLIAVNGTILVIGGTVIAFIVLRRRRAAIRTASPKSEASSGEAPSGEDAPARQTGLLARLWPFKKG